ncbi:hypothetical protein ACHAWC_002111 [Mediolabrus comicus]
MVIWSTCGRRAEREERTLSSITSQPLGVYIRTVLKVSRVTTLGLGVSYLAQAKIKMKTYSSAATTLFSVSALFGSTVSVSAYDGAYIHNGCSLDNDNYPVYDINGAMGPAWYCNDGGDISGGTDQALIHEGCVFGVHYEPYDSTWYCKDDRRGVPVDLAYIHTGCNDGVEWMTNSPMYHYKLKMIIVLQPSMVKIKFKALADD